MRSIDLKGDILIKVLTQDEQSKMAMKEQTFTRADMLTAILERPSDGYSTGEIRTAFKLLDAIGDATKTGASALLVEDNQYPVLLDKLAKFRWSTVSSSVVAFVDAVENA
ncbi:hypothetical protein EOA35_32280, partial [Mesorhizobium sp. M8A.F.Ca.ET.023.01.1.1]